jgi:hypothetical protein
MSSMNSVSGTRRWLTPPRRKSSAETPPDMALVG